MDDAITIVDDDEGRHTLPSIVHFGSNGEVLVGYPAQRLIPFEPLNTIHSVKRFLGRRVQDGMVRIAQHAYLYRVFEGPNQWPVIDARGGPYTISEICSCVLSEIVTRTEKLFGEKVTGAVISVPATADDNQRKQTRVAGRIAGLEVLGLISEPTAATLSYALTGTKGRRVVVYDFGGGTFDCAVIDWGSQTTKVLATSGDSFLGGDDIDLAMAIHIAQAFKAEHGVDLRGRQVEWKRLLLACEKTKRKLTRVRNASIDVDEVLHTDRGVVDLRYEISRDDLEGIVAPYVEQSVTLMLEAVKASEISADQVDQVLLVGGSSRLPLVRDSIREAMGKSPHLELDPDTAVAIGAAIHAQQLVGGRAPSIEKVPRELAEVVPHSIGLATAGGRFDPVIARNAPIPAEGMRSYSTWRDGQQEIRFIVLQGDNVKASENARLGEFSVTGLTRRPAGKVRIELVFNVGLDGLLRIEARETAADRIYRYKVILNDELHGNWQ